MSAASDWYRSSFPEGPDHDTRCLATLAAWEPLYRLQPRGRHSRDGGFRKAGDGVQVTIPGACLSTFDGSELTRLVIAAHRNACRVQVSASRGGLTVMVHPRSHLGEHFYDRHPGLADLTDAIDAEVSS